MLDIVDDKWQTKMTLRYPKLSEVFMMIKRAAIIYNNCYYKMTTKSANDFLKRFRDKIRTKLLELSIYQITIEVMTDFETLRPIIFIQYRNDITFNEHNIVNLKFLF